MHAGTAELKNQEFLKKSFDLSSWVTCCTIKSELEKQRNREKDTQNVALSKKAILGEPKLCSAKHEKKKG